jgi:photosystem II stability/assembly factor-like uncharacterized protein
MAWPPALLALVCLSAAQAWTAPRWLLQSSGVTARFRGVSAVSDSVAWASGSNGTIVRTVDGGRTWRSMTIPGAGNLDFRDIDAIDERVAYVLSIGPGDSSRISKTVDAGVRWETQFVNTDPKAFFDAMAFWDAGHGVAVSDSVEGRFIIIVTNDGGRSWTRAPADGLPAALPNEGAFAASGTNVAVHGNDDVWIGTGAASAARVLRSRDRGRTWTVSTTPLPAGPSAGIFSVAFRDRLHGIVVGGDYKKETEAIDNAAVTSDGGLTWTRVIGLSGFRSAVAYVPRAPTPSLIAVGPAGADYSADDGRSWVAIESPGFHAFGFARRGTAGWGVGASGRIARWQGLANSRRGHSIVEPR